MKNRNQHFILFANCIPVRGVKRSIVCDVQRGNYVFIPNCLYEITQFFRSDSVDELLSRFGGLDEETLNEYLDYLLEHNLGFYTDNPNEFPELQEEFITPYLLNDCIIELSESNLRHTDRIISELQLTGCQNLELRSYGNFDITLLFSFIGKLEGTRVRNVEVYNAFNASTDIDYLNACMEKYQIVSGYVIHSAPFSKIQEMNERLVFIQNEISSGTCCGNISPAYFSVNLPFFLEAKKYNSCLYRKISIDQQGNIKNCPSLPYTFGNIDATGFLEVIDHALFNSVWHINKDQIDTCRDCEFRYICSDCRAFLSNSTDKPAKCNYDPCNCIYEK